MLHVHPYRLSKISKSNIFHSVKKIRKTSVIMHLCPNNLDVAKNILIEYSFFIFFT